MATVYRFEVKFVSPFCAFSSKHFKKLIEGWLKQHCDLHGNTIESISVKEIK